MQSNVRCKLNKNFLINIVDTTRLNPQAYLYLYKIYFSFSTVVYAAEMDVLQLDIILILIVFFTSQKVKHDCEINTRALEWGQNTNYSTYDSVSYTHLDVYKRQPVWRQYRN